MLVDGKHYSTPSRAAGAITGYAANTWRFWECHLPGSAASVLIDKLRSPKTLAEFLARVQVPRPFSSLG